MRSNRPPTPVLLGENGKAVSAIRVVSHINKMRLARVMPIINKRFCSSESLQRFGSNNWEFYLRQVNHGHRRELPSLGIMERRQLQCRIGTCVNSEIINRQPEENEYPQRQLSAQEFRPEGRFVSWNSSTRIRPISLRREGRRCRQGPSSPGTGTFTSVTESPRVTDP